MTSQTPGAVPGPSATWSTHAGGAEADPSCATRLSLVRGATGAAPCKAPEGGGVGGPRADRGAPAPAVRVVAPRLHVPEPKAPRDFPQPPCRQPARFARCRDRDRTSDHLLRPAPRASAGIHRGVPVPGGRNGARPPATNATTSAREAGAKEENS
jgi:hypothetical protein